MATQKTLAITLRIRDYRETSQVLTVYSRAFGRLSLVSKGAKRKRRGGQNAADLLQLVEIVFIEKEHAGLQLLTEARVLESFPGVRTGLERAYPAFFIAELLTALTEEVDPDPEIFDLALATLRMLETTANPSVVLGAFEVRLLGRIGLMPRLDACVMCGGAIPTTGEVSFAAGAGGVVCAKCTDQVHERFAVSRGALAVLNKLADAALNRVERLRISGTIAKDVRKVLSRQWMHILGREPRMLQYLR